MTLEYVVDPSRYVGSVLMVARGPGHRNRPERRELNAYMDQLADAMSTRSVPFITAEERARLLERYRAEAEERHEVFPEATDV